MKKKKVSEEFAFWLKGGIEINDLEELVDELDVMERQVFKYHVDKEKNDFAIWIRKSLGLPKLARQIKNVKDPLSMAHIIEQHLEEEEEPKKKSSKKKKSKKRKKRRKKTAKRRLPDDIETIILAAVILVGIGAICLMLYTL